MVTPAASTHAPIEGVRAVVFDLFRTLVCPECVESTAAYRSTRITHALGLDLKEFDAWWASTREDRIRHRAPSLADRIKRYCDDVGQPKQLAAIEGALAEADRYHDESLLKPSSDVLTALTRLRTDGFRVGILSNTDEHEIRRLADSPIRKLVDGVALSIDSGFVKPELGAYRFILRLLDDIPPSNAIFVGDGEGGELLGARNSGFHRVVFMRGYVARTGFHTADVLTSLSNQADRTIDSIPEVLPLVEGQS